MTKTHRETSDFAQTQEEVRLAQSVDRTRHWKKWGPYRSEADAF